MKFDRDLRPTSDEERSRAANAEAQLRASDGRFALKADALLRESISGSADGGAGRLVADFLGTLDVAPPNIEAARRQLDDCTDPDEQARLIAMMIAAATKQKAPGLVLSLKLEASERQIAHRRMTGSIVQVGG